VAVEHAGQHGPPGAVHRLVTVQPGSDLDDAPALDRDVGCARLSSGAIEDLPASEHDTLHRVLLRPAGSGLLVSEKHID
jgi:hypothetical protein